MWITKELIKIKKEVFLWNLTNNKIFLIFNKKTNFKTKF